MCIILVGNTNKFQNVKLDRWVIMPNHFHGVIVIESDGLCRNVPRHVPTQTGIHPLIKNSVSSVVNHFKGNVKRYCNQNQMAFFAWQARFYDHIIRDDRSLDLIRRYIDENPRRWGRDRNHR